MVCGLDAPASLWFRSSGRQKPIRVREHAIVARIHELYGKHRRAGYPPVRIHIEERRVRDRRPKFRKLWVWGGAGVCAALLFGCSDDSSPATPGNASGAKPSSTASGAASTASAAPSSPPAKAEPDTRTPAELVEAGRGAYNANCIACHSMNPAQDGALGPAVAGASFELLEARILRAQYPEGYEPKRSTRVMVALPHLEPRIGELVAYLDSVK